MVRGKVTVIGLKKYAKDPFDWEKYIILLFFFFEVQNGLHKSNDFSHMESDNQSTAGSDIGHFQTNYFLKRSKNIGDQVAFEKEYSAFIAIKGLQHRIVSGRWFNFGVENSS